MPNLPIVVLTRPASRQQGLTEALNNFGFTVLALPALTIEPLPIDALAIEHSTFNHSAITTSTITTSTCHAYDLIIFVSRAAVEHFPLHMCANIGQTRMAAVGGQTAQAIRQRFGASVDLVCPAQACQQDSEALWQMLMPFFDQIKRVLIVRAEWGREWLRDRLLEKGCAVDCLATYKRQPCRWSDEQARTLLDALQKQTPMFWLFTSAESVDAVEAQFERLNVEAEHTIQGSVVTHPKVLARVRRLLTNEGMPAFELVAPNDQEILLGFLKLSKLFKS
jgi:uroporphyrinogen-III synthase